MSENEDFSTIAPDLPRIADKQPEATNQDGKGRFVPGNTAGARFKRGNRVREQHGLRTRKRAPIDRRRAVDRRVLDTIAAVEEALAERLSPQRRLILANIGRRLRDLAKMEAWENEHGLFDQRRRSLTLVSEAKHKLLESIDRALERLGLDVARRTGPTLDDKMKQYTRAAGVDAPELDEPGDEADGARDPADAGAGEPAEPASSATVDVTPDEE